MREYKKLGEEIEEIKEEIRESMEEDLEELEGEGKRNEEGFRSPEGKAWRYRYDREYINCDSF